MTIEQAIKDAIEGGWNPLEKYEGGNLRITDIKVEKNVLTIRSRTSWADGVVDNDINDFSVKESFLDPLFWQGLGKSRGWSESKCMRCGEPIPWIEGIRHCEACRTADKSFQRETWLFYLHSLIDHIAENKSVESFFENLQ